MSATWFLCTILDIHSPSTRSCAPEPDNAACITDLGDWVQRSRAWEERSGLRATAFAICVPPELLTP